MNLSLIKNDESEVVKMISTGVQPINETDSSVIVRINEKLNASGGQAFVPLFKGALCEISYDPNGKGLVSPKIPPANHLTWKASSHWELKNQEKNRTTAE